MSPRLAPLVGVLVLVLVSRAAAQPTAPATQPATAPTTNPAELVAQAQGVIATKLAAIDHEIERRRTAHPRASELLARDAQRLRALLADPAAIITTAQGADRGAHVASGGAEPQAELHVVGIYAPKHWRKNEIVEVAATERPIVLAVCAYDKTRWEVRLADGAKLQRVLVGGYHEQTLSFADPSRAVPVEMAVQEEGQRHFFAWERDAQQYPQLAATLKQKTGLEIATFQGGRAGTGGPYLVGGRSPTWYARLLEEHVEPLYREASAPERARPRPQELPRFRAIHYALEVRKPRVLPNGRQMPEPMILPDQMPRALAEFTPYGLVLDTTVPLTERINHVTADPDSGTLYGITSHDVYRIDLAGGAAAQMKLRIKGDVPQLSWLTGIAFDAKRKRIVVCSAAGSNGVGHFVAYAPQASAWSYIGEVPVGMRLEGLTYSDADDCFFALTVEYGRAATRVIVNGVMTEQPATQARTLLHRIAPDGALAAPVELSQPLPLVYGGASGARQLALANGQLMILSPPGQRTQRRVLPAGAAGAAPAAAPGALAVPVMPIERVTEPARCTAVDRETGRVLTTVALTAPVAAAAGPFQPHEADVLWSQLGSGDEAEAERARVALIAGGDAAIAALGPPDAAGPLDAARLRELIGMLDHVDSQVRERGTIALIRMGPAVEPVLRETLRAQPSAETQSRIDRILAEVAPHDAATVAGAAAGAGADAGAGAVAGAAGAAGEASPQARRELRFVRVLQDIATPAAVERLIEISAAPGISPAAASEARAALRAL